MHEPIARLSQEDIQLAVRRIWPVLAPHLSLAEFSERILEFRVRCLDRVSPLDFKNGEPSESAKARSVDRYNAVTYHYRGIENVRASIVAGEPVCLIGWHHGAREHFAYGLFRAFPRLALFTLRKLQFGEFVSEATEDLGPLAVLKMRGFLAQPRPVFFYVDGPPTGKTVQHAMLGHQARFSLAPLQLLCRHQGLRLFPVTSRYHTPNDVYIRCYDPLETPAIPAQPVAQEPEVALLTKVLETLTQNLKELAPEQVLSRMLPYRERLAAELSQSAPGRGGK